MSRTKDKALNIVASQLSEAISLRQKKLQIAKYTCTVECNATRYSRELKLNNDRIVQVSDTTGEA